MSLNSSGMFMCRFKSIGNFIIIVGYNNSMVYTLIDHKNDLIKCSKLKCNNNNNNFISVSKNV